MARILSIDSSTKVCSVAIHNEGNLIGSQTYHLQKSHSTLLPAIIKELATNCEMELGDIQAIAISAGPGSYTGLRIGTSTAKGLAYTLDIPLIAQDSLDSMISRILPVVKDRSALLCPMIDARRMEVYCKLVSVEGSKVWETKPLVIDDRVFAGFNNEVYLFGSGSDKLKTIFTSDQFRFIDGVYPDAAYMGEIAYKAFLEKQFADLAYFEPEYLKEYRTNTPSKKFNV